MEIHDDDENDHDHGHNDQISSQSMRPPPPGWHHDPWWVCGWFWWHGVHDVHGNDNNSAQSSLCLLLLQCDTMFMMRMIMRKIISMMITFHIINLKAWLQLLFIWSRCHLDQWLDEAGNTWPIPFHYQRRKRTKSSHRRRNSLSKIITEVYLKALEIL